VGRIGDSSFDALAGSLVNMFDFETRHPAHRLILNPNTGERAGWAGNRRSQHWPVAKLEGCSPLHPSSKCQTDLVRRRNAPQLFQHPIRGSTAPRDRRPPGHPPNRSIAPKYPGNRVSHMPTIPVEGQQGA
jgi:hypothetical protein